MTIDTLTTMMHRLQASAESGTAAYPRFRQIQLGKLYNTLSSNKDAIIEALRADLGRTVKEATVELAFALTEVKTRFEASDFGRLAREEQNDRKTGVILRPKGLIVVVVEHSAPLVSLAVQLSAAIAAGNAVLSLLPSNATKLNEILTATLSSLERSCFAFLSHSSADLLAQIIAFKPSLILYPSPTEPELALAAQNSVQIVTSLQNGATVIACRDLTRSQVRQLAQLVVRGKFFAGGRLPGSVEKVLVHQDRAGDLVDALLEETTGAFGANPSLSLDYGRVVEVGETARLGQLMEEAVLKGEGTVVRGGSENGSATSLFLPTILEGTKGALLRSPIQGPILPLASFASLEGALALLSQTGSNIVYAFASSAELEYFANESRAAVVYAQDIPLEALYQPLPPTLRSPSIFNSESTIVSPTLSPTSSLFAPFTASSQARIASLFPREKQLVVKRKPHSTPFLRSFFPQGLLLVVGSLSVVVMGSVSVGGYKAARWLVSKYL
ncbi:Aldehyde/histidinol dehydrogenase [Leucosporidium creatinivorum]|uniref:Aldehyde/histidinol dehydrogenase n=1 Tax=Leucosporidium creatinivorum TaxID=106004 RepID=A0A1Y2G0C7_9BASI|nr:Aldehyde/histidinol dehydrogenase [Leucosporidium creatinivorum]